MRGLAREGIIMGGIVAAITVAGLAFGYLPNARRLQRIAEERMTVQASLEADAQKASAIPELLWRVEAMKGKHKDFDRRLPKRQELGGFLREISQDLAHEDLADQIIEPGKTVQADMLFTLPIVMKFRGSYLSLARFLERIDRFERLTCVQKLAILPGPSEGVMEFTVQMNIYFTES